ncbi:high-affinity iron transporter [Paenibacillus sp. 1_12]|uniref:FTR1 family iron permease n=1 Tax=Paenibacillus sp. 1_12 TaxID=1566278 RepID=UPI0008E35ECE|nr:FTR1 family protein [Paenibacillus sp. 1_12]SFL35831.1 high-affinity iron transporter [Paenibacillus sp. 1_12]
MSKVQGLLTGKVVFLFMTVSLLLLLALGGRGFAAAVDDSAIKELLPLTGGALVHAGQKDWKQAAGELEELQVKWKALNPPDSELTRNVNDALAVAKQALGEAEGKPDPAYQAFSKLTKATEAYVTSQESSGNKGDGKSTAKSLLPILQQSLDALQHNQLQKAQSEYKRFNNQWLKVENVIRSDQAAVYSDIETQSSLTRISLQAEPPRLEAAIASMTELAKTIEDYSNGKVAPTRTETSSRSVADAQQLLNQAQEAIHGGQYPAAGEKMQAFIRLWPSVEGAVLTRSPETYTRIENQMAEASGYLLSVPPKGDQASSVIATMVQELEPYMVTSAYTAWDAALILLREGVEALLVLAALIAFLNRSGNHDKTKWVWGGAATGLLLSGVLAVVLTYALASVSAGTTREMIEGYTGLLSVLMMLTVGAWLHGKSKVQAWNQYIHQRMGMALAKGNLWSLFLVAGLAILREGAETTIFYIGIAPSIEPLQLITGIGGALIVLIVLGIIVIKGSVKLPIRPFFLVATLLIYYLVFKFLGQSIHSLQVAGQLSAHSSSVLPTWTWLGLYPTWETTCTQLFILLVVALQMIRTELKKKSAA